MTSRFVDEAVADQAWARLVSLQMTPCETRDLRPWLARFDDDAQDLMDVWREHGIEAIAQTDLDERIHRNRSLADLGRMSGEILDAFFSRLPEASPCSTERPPMISLPDYLERFPQSLRSAKKKA